MSICLPTVRSTNDMAAPFDPQVSDHPGHGDPLHCPDGELPGGQHPLRLEEHLCCVPPGCLRSRREHRGAGLPDHGPHRQYVALFPPTSHLQVEKRACLFPVCCTPQRGFLVLAVLRYSNVPGGRVSSCHVHNPVTKMQLTPIIHRFHCCGFTTFLKLHVTPTPVLLALLWSLVDMHMRRAAKHLSCPGRTFPA